MILDRVTPRRSAGRRLFRYLLQLIYCSRVYAEITAGIKKPRQWLAELGML